MEAVATEIDRRSKEVEAECIAQNKKRVGSYITPVLKQEKLDDPDCRGFIAHGPAMTKVIQRRMIDKIGSNYRKRIQILFSISYRYLDH